MILIFGGAFQGKMDFAKENFGANGDNTFTCSEDNANIDLTKDVIYGFEKYSLACVKAGKEAADIIPELKDKVVICTDISSGVVPIEKEQRANREMTGRAMIKMAKTATRVYRIFCGMSMEMKNEEKN